MKPKVDALNLAIDKATKWILENLEASNDYEVGPAAVRFEEEARAQLAALLDDLAEAVEALEQMVEASPCQNGCAADDMTCATQRARAAIAKARGEEQE